MTSTCVIAAALAGYSIDKTSEERGVALKPDEIRTSRIEAGLTQAELAERFGVSQTTISSWETGKGIPSDEDLKVLGHILLPDVGRQRPAEGEAPESTSLQQYGDWIAAARAKKNFTRAQLAQRAGVSVPAVYSIETGRTNPRASTRRKLELALAEKPPTSLVTAVQEEAEIKGVGSFEGFDPHDAAEWPGEPGVYVFYDISDRPIYVGESGDIRKRIKSDHQEKFWYKRPIVETASYVKVSDQKLRRQLENTMIKFLKSNAVINKRQVDRVEE